MSRSERQGPSGPPSLVVRRAVRAVRHGSVTPAAAVPVHAPSVGGPGFRRLGFVLALLAAIVAGVHGAGLRIQHTPSLPMGLYRTIDGAPDRGTIGMWCLPPTVAAGGRALGYLAAGSCADGTEPLGKIVLGIAGDTIRYGAAGVVLNGRLVPNTRPLARDSQGRALAHAPFGTHVLRAGEVWLWSPFSAASWDSRYFGPIPTAALVSLVAPVWTLSHTLSFELPFLSPFEV